MRKRVTFILIALVLCVSLACGLDVPGGDFPPMTPTPSEPTPTAVIINAPQANPTSSPPLASPTSTPRPPTPTPQAAGIRVTSQATIQASPVPTTPVSTEMVTVPAGTFTIGHDGDVDDEKPPHEVDLPEYRIDILEVTNAQFAVFVQATGYQTEAERAGSKRTWRTEWGEGKDNHPAVRVSWNDAIAYCQWVGKRLPTEAEWEKAARGPDGFIYPWGNSYDPAKANGRDSGLRGTAPVGSYPQGISPYGLLDMAGNAQEWTADPGYLPYPGNTVPSSYYGDALRVLRGGGWFDDAVNLRTTRRNPTSPSAANWDIGFRCAR